MRAVYMIMAASMLTLMSIDAPSQDTFIMGVGNSSCAQYIAAAEGSPLGSHRTIEKGEVTLDERKQLFIEFASGIVTGNNLHKPSKRQIRTDPAALELWLKNYCTNNPTDFFANAVFNFVREVAAK